MNFSKTVLFCLFIFGLTNIVTAQHFLPSSSTFSHNKVSYITLENGTQIKGEIKDLDRKKGLIKEIKIKDHDGKVQKIAPKDIKFMYLPQSGWDKLSNTLDFVTDAQAWDNPDVDQAVMGEGYAYFEKSDVMIKKKKRTMLMMLLNPAFSSKIKVYFDPFASESMSAGVGGITLAGGDAKSYYIKEGNETAYRLQRKDYKSAFPNIFAACPSLISMHKDNLMWNELDLHIYTYTLECTTK